MMSFVTVYPQVDSSIHSQALIAELFQKDVRTINEHLKNVYREGELEPEGTIRKFRIVRREGKREVARQIEHYNLDAILTVGYRVRSSRGEELLGRLEQLPEATLEPSPAELLREERERR